MTRARYWGHRSREQRKLDRLRRQEQAADAHAKRQEACCAVEYAPGEPFQANGRWFVVPKRLHEDDEE